MEVCERSKICKHMECHHHGWHSCNGEPCPEGFDQTCVWDESMIIGD